MSQYKSFIFLCLLLLAKGASSGTNDSISKNSDKLSKKRLTLVITVAPTLYAGSMVGLYSLWYANYPKSSFHFFNDNQEWLKMDKCGHTMTSYYIGKIGYESLRWSGVSEKRSVWYGGVWGLLYLTSVEVFDGVSKEWGFSPGDMTANTLGTAIFIGQQLAWHEQKFLLKWSFHLSKYAQYNPDQLGANWPRRMVKDYNGQTYWLSANLYSMGLKGHFPKWLNLAAGYGAEGMISARSNPAEIGGKTVPSFERYSQFYLAPDIDLTRIPVKSKTMKLILNAIGFIKVPMPALEMNKHGLKFHGIYF